jgi:hypothetical protein
MNSQDIVLSEDEKIELSRRIRSCPIHEPHLSPDYRKRTIKPTFQAANYA